MAQSPWTANDMATARNLGTAGCIFFINFAHIWLQVIAFLGGPGLVHSSTRLGPPLLKWFTLILTVSHMNNRRLSLLASAQFYLKTLLKMQNFKWNSRFESAEFHMKFLQRKCPSLHEFLCLEVPKFKWISPIGSAKFHLNFLAWKCQISLETAAVHLNFSVWKCQISIEFARLAVHSFIWIFDWKGCISYKFPGLEVPNFR